MGDGTEKKQARVQNARAASRAAAEVSNGDGQPASEDNADRQKGHGKGRRQSA